MNDRIQQLRKQSVEAIPYISEERALLMTEFYQHHADFSDAIPIQRAKAFDYLLKHKALCINDLELIIGERGCQLKATPTYPELCTHSEQDLHILHHREKIAFKVSEKTKDILLNQVKPFWSGKSIRDKIFAQLPQEWKKAYAAGIFTEFMEQRAPGHTVADDKLYRYGMKDFIQQIDSRLNDNNILKQEQIDQLQAMKISAQALINFAKRHAEALKTMVQTETKESRRHELLKMAEICQKVPENAPQTFHEALQYYWFVHLGVITELNTWDSFNPGRLDQHLFPFYQKETDEGSLNEAQAKELLMAFWIKFNNQPAPPKVGVTAQESNTYTDFCLINVGGLDKEGNDACNPLTFMILDVIEEMRLLQPSSMVQISHKNPNEMIKRALKIIKTGFGQPSLFNTDAIIEEMLRQGKDIVDARLGGASGCVETGAFGKEAYILTGYFNLPKMLELALNNGYDHKTKQQLGPQTGTADSFTTYEALFTAFKLQLNHFIEIKIQGNLLIESLYAQYLPAPFMSLLIDDCIQKGKDYNNGGARYNSSYIQGVGTGTLTDSLSAIKYHVFECKKINHSASLSLSELNQALLHNFENQESLRQNLLVNTPRYGNDEDYADVIMQEIFNSFFEAVDGKANYKGGHFRINMLPTTCHVYFGSVLHATADGRMAYTPISEGISPVQGTDVNGPTAVIKSAAKMNHIKTGGTLLNQKFTPDVLADDAGIEKVMYLVRSYFKMMGHHIQFNVVDAETLRLAKENPQDYRDLIVRVAGYSDYFVDLTEALQDEIILRTGQTI